MPSPRPAFARAAACPTDGGPGFSLFWMLVWAIAIDDDRQRREKERRRNWLAQPPRKPASGPAPRPF